MSRKYRFIDLFAGIGGFHQALTNHGMECVFASEKDPHARVTYRINHNIDDEVFNDDIRFISPSEVPDHDILCAGFPCQPFSQAGRKVGIEDSDGTERGNLFFCILDILEEKRPKAFILENVRHLLKHDEGRTFKLIHKWLRKAGYSVEYKIIKASDVGLPQHRPRIFIVGFDESQVNAAMPFLWPAKKPLKMNMSDILGGECDREVGFTLRVGGRGSGIDDRRNWDAYRVNGEVVMLNPRQGLKMMGYPDEFILPNNLTQAMKQLGNSVCVDVVSEVADEVQNYLKKNTLDRENTMAGRYNKGEWSELYAFMKLIHDRVVSFGNDATEPTEEFVTILDIKHNDADTTYALLNSTISIRDVGGNEVRSINTADVIDEEGLNKIREEIIKGSKTFTVESLMGVMEALGVDINFQGNSNAKPDLIASLDHNGVKYSNDPLGVKSFLGSPPTLLNAGSATNFIYKVDGLQTDYRKINAIDTRSKIRDRINSIIKNNGSLTFVQLEKPLHEANLRKVDSLMPEILSEILVNYYSSKASKLPDLIKDDQKVARVKDHLKAVMLGMFSLTEWDGNLTSNGSIVVKRDGSLLLYHVVKEAILKEYLFQNTKLDTPSTTRHRFGSIYEDNGSFYIKLNLQIRMV